MSKWELEAHQVSKQFPDGTLALQEIEWAEQKGQTMALICESVSVKTTIFR
jgi:ABC-type phosphate/phosphonate transport system ATPase subunit